MLKFGLVKLPLLFIRWYRFTRQLSFNMLKKRSN